MLEYQGRKATVNGITYAENYTITEKDLIAIHRVFRKYGEDFLGKKCMNHITDAQIEKARCFAFSELNRLSKLYGLRPAGTVKELFCNYIFSEFI